MKTFLLRVAVVLALAGLLDTATAQISVSGVTDRAIYTDQVTFRITPQAEYNYLATLNGAVVPVGQPVTVERMDHYELFVTATPTVGGDPLSSLIQFIVRDSDRGSPETGLIKWVPYPPVPSARGEFAGAQLEIIHPSAYPPDLDIPIIARVWDAQGQARRVNGTVALSGSDLESFRLVRGAGFGLGRTTNRGAFSFQATVGPLASARSITITPATWTPTSGTLPAVAAWTEDSRIALTGSITVPTGGLLEIEAGTVVLVSPGVNIVNNGRIVLRGSQQSPIIFTAATRVAPEVHTGAWGGFIMRNAGAEIVGEGAIFTGSGAAESFSFSPGSSHRSEQALFLAQAGTRVQLTNCYVVNQAGQIANGYNADVTYDRCLLQRAITSGEYVGGTIIVNRSSLFEFPAIDDVYDATIVDSDYDGIYFTTGTHILLNSFIGFAKDDAIDSGSGGAGTVVVSNCWVESALHEALAWSGEGRQTWTYDTILLNNGQGIECGWSTGNDTPLCRAERLLSIGNSVGARYGDNYTGTSGLGLKTGFLWLTNSLFLHNYRDVWGRVWDDTWNYRSGRMDVRSNYLTGNNGYHPENAVWNPSTDASRLEPFLRTSVDAGVGIGLAVWSASQPRLQITNGVPVRLSTFTSKAVSIDYTVTGPAGPIQSGTLNFAPGEMVRQIGVSPAMLGSVAAFHVTLSNPSGGELTGAGEVWYLDLPTPPPPPTTTLVPRGAIWKYLDTGANAGTAWRASNFNDSAWLSGPAELGFGDGGEATMINGGPSNSRYITTYFRSSFNVVDRTAFASLGLWLRRDDAGVAYLNGTEVFRSPNLPASPATILNTTLATATGEDTIDTATISPAQLINGSNIAAVEIHQAALDSSDLSFTFELTGLGTAPAPRLEALPFSGSLLLYWNAAGYSLESATALSGPWKTISTLAPVLVNVSEGAAQFYRLRK